MKRIFLIILDSFGIGELPDAYKFGDEEAILYVLYTLVNT